MQLYVMGRPRDWNLCVLSGPKERHRHGMDGLTEGNAYETGGPRKAN
jgi:hypothetical protein